MSDVTAEGQQAGMAEDDGHEEHALPVGALIITLSYLLLLTLLWLQVYLQLLNSGGIQQ